MAPEVGEPAERRPAAPAPRPANPNPPEEAAAGGAHDVVAELSPRGWHLLLEQLGLRGIVYNIASNCELRSVDGDRLQFVLDPANVSLYNSGHLEQIKKALQQQLGRSLSVEIEPGELRAETPVQVQQRQAQERQQSAVASLEADPVLRDLISRFDGELDRASIVPVD
jgi:DNA polymerase-3 subunit gamma/tau